MSSTSRRFPLNRTLLLLTLSDVFNWGFYQIIPAIAGLYLANRFGEQTVSIVGIGISIYLVTRGLFQIPIGVICDRMQSNRDEIIFLLVGNVLMAVPYFLYPAISEPVHYFSLQFAFGLGAAMNLVTWRKLFAGSLNKGQEGYQYATYETIMSLMAALLSAIAGIVAGISHQYFDLVMVMIGATMLLSALWAGLILRTGPHRTMVVR